MEPVALPPGPARDLQKAIYWLYAAADTPTLDDLAKAIAADDTLPGSPGKDLIGKTISGEGLASQQNTVTVAVALAHVAGRDDTAEVAEQIRERWIAARTTPPPARLGRPVSACDPFDLEVHQAIQLPGIRPDSLPGYVPRAHDDELRDVVDQVLAGGPSRLLTVVGGSSTGKTRTCWELARYVEQKRPAQWWLWHPHDPTRPEAATAAIDQAVPNTIIWLNEAQLYLAPTHTELGERIAAGLRTLLRDPQRRPVLVLATLWPHHWNTLTARPKAGEPDPYAQARDLLAGTRISVPDTFTPDQLTALRDTDVDPRLRHAADHAEDGRIIQYLAGAPALEERYRTAPPAARAIIQVAIDARRLGHPLPLPHALLEQAAPGYLNDHDWDTAGEDWLEQALAYTAQPCKGARGPLTRIRSRTIDRNTAASQPCYRLADYLEHIGRTERAGIYPPDSLWTAFTTTITTPDLLGQLGQQAEHRGRYQHAIWLYNRAADRGDTVSLRTLVRLREWAGDTAGAEALATQAGDRSDTTALCYLAQLRERALNLVGAEALYQKAANHGDTLAMRNLARLRLRGGDTAGAEALLAQAADRGDTDAMRNLDRLRLRDGDTADAEVLAIQAADRGDPTALWNLAMLRERAGSFVGAEALYRKAANHGHTRAWRSLARLREQAGDSAGAEDLYQKAADRGDTTALRNLAQLREQAGDPVGAEALAIQAADRGDPTALWYLAQIREQTGNTIGAELLYQKAVDRGDTSALWGLTRLREQAGDPVGAEALAIQAAARGSTIALSLLTDLREQAGDTTAAEILALQAANHGDTTTLWHLAGMRKQAGDIAGAEALYQEALNHGHTDGLWKLAELREQAGDSAGAEDLYRKAADRGDPDAVWKLAELREQAGDTTSARRTERFGLTGTGETATKLDFGP
ncbi:tetratricopeptide repeat protein [Polymorphospora sp. NPDC050346]|uniref:tetratricopeptide repeat protein n=1 Tax=Polymorphospora sp. NPDC050346 TaxID=3155780 RepID=UPI0033EB1A1B